MSQQWDCSFCTYVNDDGRGLDECILCQHKRPRRRRPRRVVVAPIPEMEGATWMSNVDERGDMHDVLRLSQGLSQCHVDEGSSRLAAEVRTNSLSSKVGECVGPSIGIFNYVNDASLGSSDVANMADGGGDRLPPRPSGGLHTSSSGGISQRRLEQEQPFSGNLSRNAALMDASSLSLSFSNLKNKSNTNESSIVTAGNENDNGGGNNGTMMTRMVDCKHLYGADDRFVPSGVLSNSAFELSTDTTLSSGGVIVSDKSNSNTDIVPDTVAAVSDETITRRGNLAGGGGGVGGGRSYVDNELAHRSSSTPHAKFTINTAKKSATKEEAEKENKTRHANNVAGMKKRQQITLTQGDYLEETAKKKKTSTIQKGDTVRIKKPGSLTEWTYSKGEVWESLEYEGCAFTLGCINCINGVHEADIQEMWMKLDRTYIGPNQAASVREKLGCDWVMVEKHGRMPTNRRIKLKTLHHKLASDVRKPTTYYIENGPSSFAYFEKCDSRTIPQQNTDRPIALDIFAGGGGMSIGLKRAGWNVKYKVEMNESCCKTLRHNFKKKTIFQYDVAKFLQQLKSGSLKIDKTNVTLIHGSPPCQGFSMANTSGGENDDQNKRCTLDFLEVIECIKPPFVSMENVPGLASTRKINGAKAENKSYLQTVVGKLLSMGYNVRTTMTVATNFGDPQERKRLVLLASKQGYDLPTAPLQTHGDGFRQKIVTAQDVLHDLEDVKPNYEGRVKLNGKTVHAHSSTGTVYASISDNDIRLRPDEPAKTVRKKNKIVHYRHKRYLTLLEYKRLMSFPDKHILCGNPSQIRDQIGNAVPCRFAEAIGKAIMKSYRMGKFLPNN